MTKTILFASAAVFALTAGGASATPVASHSGSYAHHVVHSVPKGSKTLYDQNSNDDGEAIDSQNFESTFAAYDDAGADDFTVPSGHTWKVSEVDVTGQFFVDSGPSSSENVTFYSDAGGKPGKAVKKGTFTNLNGSGSPSYSLKLGKKGVKLKAGTYWVSVVANCAFESCGEWGWEMNGAVQGNPAVWENPGGGFGICPKWDTVLNCIGASGDFMFALQGKDKG
jgi:hypothetical protein